MSKEWFRFYKVVASSGRPLWRGRKDSYGTEEENDVPAYKVGRLVRLGPEELLEAQGVQYHSVCGHGLHVCKTLRGARTLLRRGGWCNTRIPHKIFSVLVHRDHIIRRPGWKSCRGKEFPVVVVSQLYVEREVE
jgi:hypothetical protein